MKVSELVEYLKDCDQDAEVFVSSDEEGNSFRRASLDPNAIMIDQNGEVFQINKDDIAAGEYEGWEDAIFGAVVFW